MCFARGLYCYNTSVKYLLVTLYSFYFIFFFGKLATKQMLASDNILMKKQYQ